MGSGEEVLSACGSGTSPGRGGMEPPSCSFPCISLRLYNPCIYNKGMGAALALPRPLFPGLSRHSGSPSSLDSDLPSQAYFKNKDADGTTLPC